MKKRIFSILLVICLCMTLLPVSAFAEAAPADPVPSAAATAVPEQKAAGTEEGSGDGNTSGDPVPAAQGDEPGDSSVSGDISVSGDSSVSDDSADSAADKKGQMRVMMIQPDQNVYYTYNFYDGETLISTQTVKNGDTLNQPEPPQHEHQKFTGWNPEVAFGTVSGLTGENKTVNVYAQYTTVHYVFFKDAADGRVVATRDDSDGPVSTSGVTFQVDPNSSIVGWKDEAAGKTYGTDEVVTVGDSDVTLVADIATGYWITFNAGADDATVTVPEFVANGSATVEPAAPTRPGYTFAGWQDAEGNPFVFGSLLTADITLTAGWTAETSVSYTVIHWRENANDDGYSFYESETLTGPAGAMTNAAPKVYTTTVNGKAKTPFNKRKRFQHGY